MAASSNEVQRRRRYLRQPTSAPVTPTPKKMALLTSIAEYGIISLPQLARLHNLSYKAARKHLREMFDAGWVEVVPVPRSAYQMTGMASQTAKMTGETMSVLGSAPNVFVITRAGGRLLDEIGWESERAPDHRYKERGGYFLTHELEVKDVRIWLELSARHRTSEALVDWRDTGAAEIDLKRTKLPKVVRPDAWFIYTLKSAVLVGLIEVDRGTERGTRRWLEKITAYEALFQSSRLKEVTGYVNARILIVTPDTRRRNQLTELLEKHAPPLLQQRTWLVEKSALDPLGMERAVWQRPGNTLLSPLVPPHTGDRVLDQQLETPR